MPGFLFALAALMLLVLAPLDEARAACAEDLTRIQLATPNHAPQLRARLQQLTQDGEAKARRGDAQGCEADTKQALQLLQLPVLGPVALSTPLAGATQTAQATMPSNVARTAPASPAAAGPSAGMTGMAASSANAAPSTGSGPASEAKGASGEGASGPTSGSGHPAANASASAGTGGGDPAHGATLAQAQCGPCHSFQPGAGARVGPDLFGVTQRPIASTTGFAYSPALKAHQGGRWDPATLNAFLTSPSGFAPGTRMAFGGIAADQDRRDVIAYLQSLGGSAATGASR
jgi:cytochrome c2